MKYLGGTRMARVGFLHRPKWLEDAVPTYPLNIEDFRLVTHILVEMSTALLTP